MIPFMTNNKIYEFQANNQLSSILSMFDNDYLMDITEDTMTDMFNQFDIIPKPNIIESLENVFKAYAPNYPNQTDQDEIMDVRQDAYNSIMKLIFSKYDLQYQEDNYTDIYTMAYYVYDFFISRFNFYLVDFFARYLNSQKEDICNNLDLGIYTKNKDAATNYGRLAFGEDDYMTLITANLPIVLSSIRSLDTIRDDLIYNYAYGSDTNNNVTNLMLYHVSSPRGIYDIYTRILFNPDLYPSVITQIRLRLQMLYQFNKK